MTLLAMVDTEVVQQSGLFKWLNNKLLYSN
jgi:hypothetical protein